MAEDLEHLYQSINQRGLTAITNGRVQLDPVLQSRSDDRRRGLTLLGYLPAHVCRNIEFALQRIKATAPDQYYYPASTMHITIMDILAGQLNLSLSPNQLAQYQRLIRQFAAATPAVHWRLSGLIASPGAIMVKGYYSPALSKLRANLRDRLPAAGLRVQERYPTFSGHVTVARFRVPVTDGADLAEQIQRAGQLDFGEFTMHTVSLVVHDWYNRQIDSRADFPLAN